MRNKWNNAWKELCGNRGSGVVLVLVAISCITLMAVSLLHMSYTAFKMKSAERLGKKDFYTADAHMDELLAGVQAKVSDAIAEAHLQTLMRYASNSVLDVNVTVDTKTTTIATGAIETQTSSDTIAVDEDVRNELLSTEKKSEFDKTFTALFQNAFFAELTNWAENVPEEFFDGIYDVNILSPFLSGGTAVTFVENGNRTYDYTEVTDDAGNIISKNFTLHNVCFAYHNTESEYDTTIKLDIVIQAPDFHYVQEGDSDASSTATWNIEDLVTFENWSTY